MFVCACNSKRPVLWSVWYAIVTALKANTERERKNMCGRTLQSRTSTCRALVCSTPVNQRRYEWKQKIERQVYALQYDRLSDRSVLVSMCICVSVYVYHAHMFACSCMCVRMYRVRENSRYLHTSCETPIRMRCCWAALTHCHFDVLYVHRHQAIADADPESQSVTTENT